MGRVLVIDDDRDLLMVVTEILEAGGHEVTVSASGVEGLALCREKRHDVVIVDIAMPGMDGVAVVRALLGAPVKIIAVSGGGPGGFSGLQEAARLGARTLLKPFRRQVLLATVAEMLAT